MTITLEKKTLEKKEKILKFCEEILWEDVVTIRFLSKIIGNLVAVFPAVTLGPFYWRVLEMEKVKHCNSPMETMMPQLDYPMKRRKNYSCG